MLSEKHAALAVKILSLVLIAVFSFFAAARFLPESGFVRDSLQSVEDSSNTVMELSAAALSTSLAISALPDDFATPLADSLADMNAYFVAILVVLFLEKLLIQYGIRAAFAIFVPLACLVGILFVLTKKAMLKSLAVRICILGLAAAFVVPCSTHLTGIVASDLNDYVDETIQETEKSAGKLNEAVESGGGDRTLFETLSDLFQTAVHGVSDLMLHFRDTIRKCMNSIAILILTNCIMPLLTIFLLKWILGELFRIALPMPAGRGRRGAEADFDAEVWPEERRELVRAGGSRHEE